MGMTYPNFDFAKCLLTDVFLCLLIKLLLNLYLISYNEPLKNFLDGDRKICLNRKVQFHPVFICLGASKKIYIPKL